MLALLSFGLLLLAPGLPLALLANAARPRRTVGAGAFAYDALVLGLAAQLLAGLALARAGAFTATGILATTAASATAIAVVTLTLRRHLPRLSTPTVDAFSLACGAIFLAAAVLRRNPIEFVFMTGDMGEYVNTAILLAAGETLIEGFPHLFPIFLAFPAALFGPASAVDALPLAGLLLIGGVLRAAAMLGVAPFPRLLVATLVASSAVPVWFSLFPVSEALYAPLLMAMIVFAARGRAEASVTLAIVAGLLVLPLALLRGNAFLLLAVIVVDLFAVALSARFGRVDLVLAATALASLELGFAYDLAYLPRYVVVQIREFAPVLAEKAARFGLLEVGASLAAAALGSIAAATLLAAAVHRFARSRLANALASGLPAIVLAGMGLALTTIGWPGVLAALGRMGAVFAGAGVLGLVLAARPGSAAAASTVGRLGLLLFAVYTVLRARHRALDLPHAYYLYWDRYLFSEVFPALTLGALVAIGLFWERFARVSSPRTRTIVAIAALAFVLGDLRTTLRVTRHHLFGDATAFVTAIGNLASPTDVPFVYSGLRERVPVLWFPNTYRFVATPLTSLGHRFANDPGADRGFSPDPALAFADVERFMRRRQLARVFVVRLFDPTAPLDEPPPGLAVRRVGEITHVLPLLHQMPETKERWERFSMTVEVWDVARAGVSSP